MEAETHSNADKGSCCSACEPLTPDLLLPRPFDTGCGIPCHHRLEVLGCAEFVFSRSVSKQPLDVLSMWDYVASTQHGPPLSSSCFSVLLNFTATALCSLFMPGAGQWCLNSATSMRAVLYIPDQINQQRDGDEKKKSLEVREERRERRSSSQVNLPPLFCLSSP